MNKQIMLIRLTTAVIAIGIGLALINKFVHIQLFPDIEKNIISVEAEWPLISAKEIENTLVTKLEESLLRVRNVESMRSVSYPGRGVVELEFAADKDRDKLFFDVIQALQQIRNWPTKAQRPRARFGGEEGSAPILTFLLLKLKNQAPPTSGKFETYNEQLLNLNNIVNSLVIPEINKVTGVYSTEEYVGALDSKVEVKLYPIELVKWQLSLSDVIASLASTGVAVSGEIDFGSKRYVVRAPSSKNIQQIGNTIVGYYNDSTVYLSDVADVKIGTEHKGTIATFGGDYAVALRVNRASGANTLAAIAEIKVKMAALNSSYLDKQGMELGISYDASVFIHDSINTLKLSLIGSMILAILCLWLFIRNKIVSFVIALSLPLCIIFTLLVFTIFGKSINLITLASLALTIGMVLDASIICFEGFIQNSDKTKSRLIPDKSIIRAILASSFTTVVIFLPIMIMGSFEAKLFSDLALSVTCAICFSVIYSFSLPWLYNKIIGDISEPAANYAWWKERSSKLSNLVNWVKWKTLTVCLLLIFSSMYFFVSNIQQDYLPQVQRNSVDIYYQIPGNVNDDTIKEKLLATVIERFENYIDSGQSPEILNYFSVTWPNQGVIGVRAKNREETNELIDVLKNEILHEIPNLHPYVARGNLFRMYGKERNIEVSLSHPEIMNEIELVSGLLAKLEKQFPNAQLVTSPNLTNSADEINLQIDQEALKRNKLLPEQAHEFIKAVAGGLQMQDLYLHGQNIPLVIKIEPVTDLLTQLGETPMYSSDGVSYLNDIVDIEMKKSPGALRREQAMSTVVIKLTPGDEEPIGSIVKKTQQIIDDMAPDIDAKQILVQLKGDAKSIKGIVDDMKKLFLFAFVVLFLACRISGIDSLTSFVIMVFVGMTMLGGLVIHYLSNLVVYTPFDMLSMLGLLTGLGVVINSNFLLTEKFNSSFSRNRDFALSASEMFQHRLFSITASTVTTVVGLLPLILVTSEGSVLYRGLAATLLGTIVFGYLINILLYPSALTATIKLRKLVDSEFKSQVKGS